VTLSIKASSLTQR